MALTDTAIRNAKPQAKPVKLFDGGGLYIEVSPSGGKWWRLKYRIGGKEKRISLGTYPETTLKEARERRDEARKLLGQGVDPSDHKKAAKRAEAGEDSFEHIAREWHGRHMANKSESHAAKTLERLQKDVFPWIGSRSARDIAAPELLAVLRRIESRGAIELCHVTKRICGQVFRYAIATGRAERDPAADLKGALQPVKSEHFAAITDPKAIGELLRAIEGYTGHFPTLCALKLSPLVMLRPGEVRQAEWTEIDLEAAEWRIPASKMKMRDEHIVPLSRRAIEILEAIRPLTGRGRYVFPSARTASGAKDERPMSENAITAALRRLGYTGKDMTAHGFRSMASTRLNESHLFHPDAIERQLAHGERDSVRAAYNRAEHLPERRKMMQWWADYLDGLRTGAEVIQLERRRA
ncbi:tyrosine-type recombinase/integrase [Methylococcus capsulatus]|uniref:tyrosine-type recombinase/integrase n=1 Tax=Methylococcus capsulatus TaxID=414 RepID=UPI001C532451|nr:integrase arm-type DNA-binding domain-containing protein [Methylococcus capsulatus]QXP90115.1 integrase arm-type DNA-binding domain-containing protein [Methylococcus capsulatus]